MVNDVFREAGIAAGNIKVRMTLSSPEFIVQMVQAGLGVGFASKWSVFTAVKDGTVKLVNVTGKAMKRHFFLVSLEKGAVSGSINTFREFMKEYKLFVPF